MHNTKYSKIKKYTGEIFSQYGQIQLWFVLSCAVEGQNLQVMVFSFYAGYSFFKSEITSSGKENKMCLQPWPAGGV